MGYLKWPILKQIFDLCFTVMRFIYNNISSNVGLAIIFYALFVHALFIPFSVKSCIDRKRNGRAADEIKKLKTEFANLPEEERNKESVRADFKERERQLKKKKVSLAESCFVILLRMFVLLATTPVVIHLGDFFGSEVVLNYNFLGFDLSAPPPGFSLQPSLVFPIITTMVLAIPGFVSTIKNMRDRAAIQAAKTPEELAEEAKMLQEMGIKDNKIPWGIIIQFGFTLFYFWSFSQIALTASLFWGAYYIMNFMIKGIFNHAFVKIAQQLRKRPREECNA